LWQNIRNQSITNQVTQKPINDQLWGKVMSDVNPFNHYQAAPQPQATAPLAPEDAPDALSMASLYEPPPQLGGSPSLLQDPVGFGSLDRGPSLIGGGGSSFFQKYGKLRNLDSLGQQTWNL
jgi:hypothetical protein